MLLLVAAFCSFLLRRFLYSQMQGYSLERSAQVGCLAGAAAVRTMGAELTPADWAWFHARMNGAHGHQGQGSRPQIIPLDPTCIAANRERQ